jgi:hypothetical protein
MSTLVGRLNQLGFVIPASRHFLGRIRHFEATVGLRRTQLLRRTHDKLR